MTHADVFSAARMHSRRVKFLKAVLPLIAIAIAIVFSWFTFFVSSPATDIVTLNSAFGSNNKLVMMQPKVEGYNRDMQPYALSAARAIQNPKQSGMIELEDISATLPFGERGAAYIQAQGGVFDNINGRMLLGKPFQINTNSGVHARFLSADVDITSSHLVSKEKVEISRDSADQHETLTSQRLRILDGGKIFLFEGGVRLIIAEKQP